MDLAPILENLGLSEKEAATYLAILQLGSSTVSPISVRAKVKRTSIYNFIGRLIELGLVSKVSVRGKTHFQALDPSRLLELERSRLRKLEESLPQFVSLFNLHGQKPRINYYEGSQQMQNIVREEPRCKKEALYIWPGMDVIEMIGGANFMTEIDKSRIEKGVWVRTVRFRHKDSVFQTSAHGEKFKRELRFAPPSFNISMGVGIYDTGKVGFFSSKRESFGILIESQELMMLMKSLFTLLWERALPARSGEG